MVDKDGLSCQFFGNSDPQSHIEAFQVYRTFVHGTMYGEFLLQEFSDFNWPYGNQVGNFFASKRLPGALGKVRLLTV